MGWIRGIHCEKFRRDFVARTFALVRPVLHQFCKAAKRSQMARNAPKHEFSVQWGGSGAFVAKCSCHEVASEFFSTNAPDPPHCTLNSCFGAFHTIWVHLGLLSCLMELGGKTFRTSAKVCATKSGWNFSQQTHLIHPIGL